MSPFCVLFRYEIIVTGRIGCEQKDLIEGDASGTENGIHPFFILTDGRKRLLTKLAVGDDDLGRIEGRGRDMDIFFGGGLNIGFLADGNIAVGFDDGELHFLDAEDIVAAQGGHKIIDRKAQGMEHFLIDFSITDDNFGTAGDESAQAYGMERAPRDDHLKADHSKNGKDAAEERRIGILKGKRCDIGNENGHNKLSGLKLPELTFAHESDRTDHKRINNE